MLFNNTVSCPAAETDDPVFHLRIPRVASQTVLRQLPEPVSIYLKAHRWCRACSGVATRIALWQAQDSGTDFVWIMRGIGMRVEEAEFLWYLAKPYVLAHA